MARIEMRRFPLFLVAGHMYYEFIDDNGNRIAQINSGGANEEGDLAPLASYGAPVRFWDDIILDGTSDISSNSGVLVFEGTEQQISVALSYIGAFKEFVDANSQNIPYGAIPDSLHFNSNSGFAAIGRVIADTLPSVSFPKLIQAAKDTGAGGISLFTPGLDNDILKGNLWSPHLDQKGNVIGSIVIDKGGTNVLIGTNGDDILHGLSGPDTIKPGEGSDIIDGGGGDDIYDLSVGAGFKDIREESGNGTADVIKLPSGISADDIVAFQPKLGELILTVPNGEGGHLYLGMKNPRLGSGAGVEYIQIGNSTPIAIADMPQIQNLPMSGFGLAAVTSNSLVIDFSASHSGITLTTWSTATTDTFLYLNNTGFAVHTAWVSSDAGLLARDLDENGRIDSAAESFGSSTVDGFAKLAALDSNYDTWIDAVRDMLATSPIKGAEEWTNQDYEGFESVRIEEYTSFFEHGEIGAALLDHLSGNLDKAREAMSDRYMGQHACLAHYMQEVTEDTTAIPDHLRCYIDYQAMAYDAEISGNLFTVNTAWY